MPNKSNKTSKVMIVPKQSKKKSMPRRQESVSQFAIRTGLKSAAAYAQGGLPLALGSAGSDIYDYLGRDSSGPMKYQSVSAPATYGSVMHGSLTSSFSTKHVGPDTVRVRGSLMAMRITVGVTGVIYAYDSYGNFHSMATDRGGGFTVSLRAMGAATTLSLYGYPNNLCPVNSQLTPYANIYSKWRPEAIRFRYIPACPTSQVGTASIAWTPVVVSQFDNTWATPRCYGSTPYTFGTMSQFPAFASGPVWQPHALSVNPRVHGICENPKDWLSTTFVYSTDPGFSTTSASPGYSYGGTLAVAVENAGSIYAAETTLGYLMFDYDYTLHDTGPMKYPQYGIYQPGPMLELKQNQDLLTELNRRTDILRIKCGSDLDKLEAELKDCDGSGSEEYFSVPTPPAPTSTPVLTPPRSGTPVPPLLPPRR